MLGPLEVIWVADDTIKPPGPKMVVAIVPALGWFFRINSREHWRPNVPLVRVPDHLFLDHDSFLECQILELDDYVVDEAIRSRGVIGSLSRSLCADIRAAIRLNRMMDGTEKAEIHKVLQALASS